MPVARALWAVHRIGGHQGVSELGTTPRPLVSRPRLWEARLNPITVSALDRNPAERFKLFSLITDILIVSKEINRCWWSNDSYDLDRLSRFSAYPSAPISALPIELHRREPLRPGCFRAFILGQKPNLMARRKSLQFAAHQVRKLALYKRLLVFEQSLRTGGCYLYSTSPLIFKPSSEATPGHLYGFEPFRDP